MAAGSIFSNPKKSAYPAIDETEPMVVSTSPPTPRATDKYAGKASIGDGVHVKGDIHDCRQVDVYGVMDGEIVTDTLVVHQNGSVKGVIRADRAEIHGVADGELTVSDRLDIRANGLVSGIVTYRELSVEAGGRLTGQVDQHADDPAGNAKPIPMGKTPVPDKINP
jgi:cytoskeletal protein CcmA (bactofilin family)